ncbi:DEAD/DEAH box helicase [bacterium]|nr:DEAD/DEAH box helicase [bacterium]
MNTFQDMKLPQALVNTLQKMQFNKPTPIQNKAIPLALLGKDILGSAQTGTGKTGAFGIPLVAKLMSNSRGSALVMTPTRELASQIMEQLETMLGAHSKIKTSLLIGGEAMPKQIEQLKKRPRLIVGTPGRISDHLDRGGLMLHDTDFLVLDETDRMLDIGFSVQIKNIMKYLTRKRQTLLFSATLPKNIINIANEYLTNPARIEVNASCSAVKNIKQNTIKTNDMDKYSKLLAQLRDRTGSIIVFVKTKHNTERMSQKLVRAGHHSQAIHSDLNQNKRNRIIEEFRNKKYRILVATDIASRGLDISHIEHVINFDLPQCPEDYIHRIGRTGRAGAQGEALNLVSPSDMKKWNAISKLLDTTTRH